jgi:hypothetical protein
MEFGRRVVTHYGSLSETIVALIGAVMVTFFVIGSVGTAGVLG